MTIKEELLQYAERCINDEKISEYEDYISCQAHKWACSRFIADVKRSEKEDCFFYWDENEAQKIVSWFSYLRHSKGVLAGKPIELTAWEKFLLCQLYGWRRKEGKMRRFRKSFFEVGRKNAKSQIEAGVALYESSVTATKNGEVAEVYTAGTKRDQSKIVFDECKLMLKGSPLITKFRCRRDSVTHVASGSFIKPLSKQDGKNGDGTNPALLILDEYHQHQTTEFYDLAIGSNTKEPLLMIITTAGMDLTYPCYTVEYEYCKKILNPHVDVTNDEYLIDILELDEEDYADIQNLDNTRLWFKSNPIRMTYQNGVEKIKGDYRVAKEQPDHMTAFLTKSLNVWVQHKQDQYMDLGKWKACEVDAPPIDLQIAPAYWGFDMSAKLDLTSVALVIPYSDGDMDDTGKPLAKYYVESHSFIPSWERVSEHVTKDKAPYDSWARQGFITVTGTPIVDQSAVMRWVLDYSQAHGLDVQCLCFDPANASKIMMDLSNDGYDVEEVYQSAKSLNESTCTFREMVYAGRVQFKRNPVLTYAMSNAVTRQNNGLIKIDKDATARRIDPVDATLAAFKLALYHDLESMAYSNYIESFLGEMSTWD